MATLIAFTAPDPTADYMFSIADVKSGDSYSPSANGFVPNPPDELIAMSRDLSKNRPGQRYGFVAANLIPPTPGQYLVFVHPAAGGPPVEPPFPVVAEHPPSPAAAFAMTF